MDDLNTQDLPQEAPEPSLRGVLEQAFDNPDDPGAALAEPAKAEAPKVDRVRDEAGKFARAAPATPTGAPATPTGAPPSAPGATQPGQPAEGQQQREVRAPNSWKPAAQAEFAKLPPLIQEEVIRRESDFHRGVEGYRQAAQFGQQMHQALEPHRQTLQQLGVSPDQAVGALLNADAKLRFGSKEQKAKFMAQLAQEYGVDLAEAQFAPQPDPRMVQMEQELNQSRWQMHNFLQQQERQQQSQIVSEIEQFRADPSRVHFEAVRDDMAALIQTGRAANLQDAYDMAVYANPKTRSAMLEQQRQDTLRQYQGTSQAQRARSAAVSVRGSSPAAGTAAKPASLRAALMQAMDN